MAAMLVLETAVHRHVRRPRPAALLPVLRGAPRPDVPADRRLGRPSAASTRRSSSSCSRWPGSAFLLVAILFLYSKGGSDELPATTRCSSVAERAAGDHRPMAVPRVLRRVRREGAAGAAAHLAARRAHRGADGRLRAACRAAAEGRDVRADPVQPRALPRGVEVLRDVRRRDRGDRDHLRGGERVDPDRHQAARRVLLRLAPRLRRAGRVRVHPAGRHRGRAPDGEPRPRDRRAVPARGDGLRADPHAGPRPDGRARVGDAVADGRVPVHRVRLRRAAGAERVRGRVPRDRRHVRREQLVRGARRDRRGARRDLPPVVLPADGVRAGPRGAPAAARREPPRGRGPRAGAGAPARVRGGAEAADRPDRSGHRSRDRPRRARAAARPMSGDAGSARRSRSTAAAP